MASKAKSRSPSNPRGKSVQFSNNEKTFKLDYRILLFTKAQVYTHESPDAAVTEMSTWKTLTRYHIPLALIQEKTSDTFHIFAIDKTTIVLNFQVTIKTMVDQISEYFAVLKNTSTNFTWGVGFPPDGSLTLFRSRIEEIKKHLMTIPSLRKEIRVILTTTAQFGFAPIASVVESALQKENLVEAPKNIGDNDWIQKQIQLGNFDSTSKPVAKLQKRSKILTTVKPTNTRVLTARATRRILSRRTVPLVEKRPEFTVPRGKVEIPQPPPVLVSGTLFTPTEATLTNWLTTRAENYKKQLKHERKHLRKKLSKLEREKMMLEQLEKHHQMKIDAVRQSIEKSSVHERGWQMKLKPLKEEHESWKNRDLEILRFAEEMMNKPAEIREENRTMRTKLAELEALSSKRDGELRTQRLEKGLGEYVRAFRTLQKEHDELDIKIADLRKERDAMQRSIFDLSTGITKNIQGLMKTNSIAFNNIDMRLYVPDDGDKTPQEEEQRHRDPIAMGVEKVRARRIEVEGKAASMASKFKAFKSNAPQKTKKISAFRNFKNKYLTKRKTQEYQDENDFEEVSPSLGYRDKSVNPDRIKNPEKNSSIENAADAGDLDRSNSGITSTTGLHNLFNDVTDDGESVTASAKDLFKGPEYLL